MTVAAHDDYVLPEGFEHCSKLTPVVEAVSALDRVRAIVKILHEPGGCPWDAKQTNRSLVKPLLEETYEYIDALECDDRDNMREELGDMLLQSVFQAQVCSHDDQDPFNIDEVCDRLVNKLITRHPHIFTPDDVEDPESPKNAEETLALWEQAKQKEKHRSSVLEGISRAQGALPRAAKVVSRVAKSPRRNELEAAFDMPSSDDPESQYADVVITAIRAAHQAGVDIESALRNRLRDIENAIVDIESR